MPEPRGSLFLRSRQSPAPPFSMTWPNSGSWLKRNGGIRVWWVSEAIVSVQVVEKSEATGDLNNLLVTEVMLVLHQPLIPPRAAATPDNESPPPSSLVRSLWFHPTGGRGSSPRSSRRIRSSANAAVARSRSLPTSPT